MKYWLIVGLVAVGVITVAATYDSSEQFSTATTPEQSQSTQAAEQPEFEYAPTTEVTIPNGKEIATFAGGCFWCVEAVFQETAGVDDVISGFAGGEEISPSYDQVAYGLTGHREAIQFTYDPLIITYSGILDILWQSIDPTDDGGQFIDRGYIYTTAVYYHDEQQKEVTDKSVATLLADSGYDQIATDIVPFTTFYPAEEYHQDYYKKSADRYKQYESNSGRSEYKDNLAI